MKKLTDVELINRALNTHCEWPNETLPAWERIKKLISPQVLTSESSGRALRSAEVWPLQVPLDGPDSAVYTKEFLKHRARG